MPQQFYSPEEVTRRGEELYFSKLRSELEPLQNGKYVVIDVESGDYYVDGDVLAAVKKARSEHPNTLFYIAPIGSVMRPQTNNYHYAWQFSK